MKRIVSNNYVSIDINLWRVLTDDEVDLLYRIFDNAKNRLKTKAEKQPMHIEHTHNSLE